MVRKTIYRFAAFTILITILAACSTKTEYTNSIPADASAVATINLKSLVQKSGLNTKENERVKQKIMDAIKSGLGANAFKQIEKIVNVPEESGLALNEPVYFFTSRTLHYPALVFKVIDADKVHTTLEAMSSEQICQPIAKADGYEFTLFPDGSLCAYSKSTLLVVLSAEASELENTKKIIAKLMKQEPDKSAVKSNAFIKMTAQKGDVTFYASMQDLPASYTQQIGFGLSEELAMNELYLLGSFNFENGKISVNYETYTENRELEAQLKKQQKAFGTLKGSLTSYFPESTVAYAAINVKGEQCYSLLSENKEFINSFIGAERSEVKHLITHLDGEVAVAITDLSLMGMPSFIAYAEINDNTAVEALQKYAMTSPVPMYVGQTNKLVFITNNKILLSNAGKSQNDPLSKAPFASNIKGNAYYLALNAETLLKLRAVNMLGNLGEEFAMYKNMGSKVSYIEMRGLNDGKGEVTLVLKDKEKNALQQIVDFAKQFVAL
ncbi:DUF4836 family protein [uncultured Bacteroides sp.]|uniref:DUF4836 family protein n=1 Tax=uncultured Bacteroides sp. TaxID=162156 RepID=UPI002AA7FB2A|nr:DUF4836 family protein [uncultured Bacteroides sp.]